jgi:hypothetical protein
VQTKFGFPKIKRRQTERILVRFPRNQLLRSEIYEQIAAAIDGLPSKRSRRMGSGIDRHAELQLKQLLSIPPSCSLQRRPLARTMLQLDAVDFALVALELRISAASINFGQRHTLQSEKPQP